MSDDAKCPGCGGQFTENSLTAWLPTPGDPNGSKRRWHEGCHQRVYYRFITKGDRNDRNE